MGKDRLVPTGYYVTHCEPDQTKTPEVFTLVYISDNQKCQWHSGNWCTLLWSCAPTKKQLAKSIEVFSGKRQYKEFEELVEKFDSFAELSESRFGNFVSSKRIGQSDLDCTRSSIG